MENVFYWGNLVLSYGVTGYVMFQFMDEMYSPKYKEKWKYIAFYLLFVIGAISFNRIGIPILKTLYGMIAMCAISLALFKSRSKKLILIYSLIYFLYIIWIDVLSVLAVTVITKLTISIVKETSGLLFVTGLCGQLLMLGSYKLVIALCQKHKIRTIATKQNIFLIILALFEVILITYIALQIEENSNGFILMIVTLCLLGLDLYLIKLFEDISQKYQLEKEMDLRDQQMLMQATYYQSIETQYDHSRRLIHDMKNHMQTLEELYSSGSGIEAKNYAQTILESMDALSGRFKCKNRILTIIINDKILKCDEQGIEIDTQVEDLDFGFIDPFDMTTIFSNLLDNAIEACSKILVEKRKIDLKVYRFNGFVTISVRNPYKGKLVWEKDSLVSTKGGNHMGLGLKNVASAVEKYDGTMQRKSDKGYFEVKILMSSESKTDM
ncbi:sensor histidine kinase [Eubacterium callanderi]|uniref:Sensory histidine kinase DcuS n=1 Tax=Eubacterium limosum TaxID=1736 RepID=A0A6N3EEB1_EUBLI|nr:sensor histidine kinase [Eubacterium callanderi]MBO1702795.1 GHKL domain-containing protein [Eubacterium callanderi]